MSKQAVTAEDRYIQKDRMRYIKNTTCSNLCYLALLFNVFYFVLLYRQNPDYFYTIQIGASVIYNLIFMLTVFLASEAVKNYKKGYSIVLCVVGALQIVRIFEMPTKAHTAVIETTGESVISSSTYTLMIVYLLVSAAALILSAVINYTRCTALEAHVKSLETTKA